MAASGNPTGNNATSVVAEIREKLLRWGLFGVCFAVLPIVFNAVSAATRNQAFTFDSLLSDGQLLLISSAVSAASVAELFGREEATMRSIRRILVGMSFLMVCGSSLWFADIASAIRDKAAVNSHLVAHGSMWVFAFSVITGGCCVVVAELKR